MFIFVPLLKHLLNIIFAEVLINGSCARKSEHPAHLAKAISSSCPVQVGKLSSAGKVPSTMRAGDLDWWIGIFQQLSIPAFGLGHAPLRSYQPDDVSVPPRKMVCNISCPFSFTKFASGRAPTRIVRRLKSSPNRNGIGKNQPEIRSAPNGG